MGDRPEDWKNSDNLLSILIDRSFMFATIVSARNECHCNICTIQNYSEDNNNFKIKLDLTKFSAQQFMSDKIHTFEHTHIEFKASKTRRRMTDAMTLKEKQPTSWCWYYKIFSESSSFEVNYLEHYAKAQCKVSTLGFQQLLLCECKT